LYIHHLFTRRSYEIARRYGDLLGKHRTSRDLRSIPTLVWGRRRAIRRSSGRHCWGVGS
jgi:hypothetical protein